MKVVQFTIPVVGGKSVIIQEDHLPFFYKHLHRHQEMQVMWIIKGEGTLICGNQMHRFKAGEVFVIGANQPHVFKNDAGYFDKPYKKQAQSLIVFLDLEGPLSKIFDLPEMKSIKRFLSTTASGLKARKAYQKAFSEAMNELKNKKAVSQIAALLQLLQLMASSKKWEPLSTETIKYNITDTEGLRMDNVYQYTMANFTKNINLKNIASIANLTGPAFCRYFKKHTRKTYVSFLNEIRIGEACKRMMGGDYDSIATIAYETGFKNVVTFNRVFKQITGNSPKNYIKAFSLNGAGAIE